MKVAIGLRVEGDDWASAETWVTEAERLGVDLVHDVRREPPDESDA